MTCLPSRFVILAEVLVLLGLVAGPVNAQQRQGSRMPLRDGWKLQSGCVTNAGGAAISLPGFSTGDWIPTSVPHTVLGAQVDAGVYPDPFFGMNLRKIPGTDYPIGKIYGYLPMSDASPYRCSWWYRTEFGSPTPHGGLTWLHFNGINYRANVWINGKQLANANDVAGAFRAYDFDISSYLVGDQKNALAVEVFAQTEKDLGIDFLDWNPAPADKSLGLWRDVSLSSSGPVTLRNPFVSTRFVREDLSLAEFTIVADVANHSEHAVHGEVRGSIGAIQVQQPVDLAAGERKVVRFTAQQFPQLSVKHPQVWWPYQYGASPLHELHVAFVADGRESDAQNIRFGIRTVESALDEMGYRQFRINGQKILIKGGGWAPDMFYREPRERLRQELEYVRHMGLNTVRLEGKLGSDDLFELADEMGILIMAGWQCCDFWQKWDQWTPKDHQIAAASTHSQISRLRAHPSVFVWLNGSDEAPIPSVENEALAVLKERDWPNPVLSAAADRKSSITGATGVKMSGPYDYVPPEYWYLDKDKVGGAFGFNTETSPGPAIPEPSSIRRTLPQASWWPIDEQWNYHAGLGKFAQYNLFNDAMAATYGPAKDFEDYQRKAQLMAYDGERAMFEAYGANKYAATGVVQWMLNNAWPSFIWHLYDYYLVPGGGYFGTRKANEPLHVLYRYDDHGVVVVNSTLVPHHELQVTANQVDFAGRQLSAQQAKVDVAADAVVVALSVPPSNATSFLKLELHDAGGRLVSDNFYWIPARLAQLDWAKSTYYYTPAAPYADMRDLMQLPQVTLQASAQQGPSGEIRVDLRNNGNAVAFFVRVRALHNDSQEDIAPVFWDDNYVSLLPGESRRLSLRAVGLDGQSLTIAIDGWNVPRQTLEVAPAGKGARPRVR